MSGTLKGSRRIPYDYHASSHELKMTDAIKETLNQVSEGVEQLALSTAPKSPRLPFWRSWSSETDEDEKGKSGLTTSADELDPPPAFIQERIALFDELKAEYDAEAAVAKKPREYINIALDNNRVEVGKSWETTPADMARSISKSLFERVVVAEVDGDVRDLERPLKRICQLRLLDVEHPEGK